MRARNDSGRQRRSHRRFCCVRRDSSGDTLTFLASNEAASAQGHYPDHRSRIVSLSNRFTFIFRLSRGHSPVTQFSCSRFACGAFRKFRLGLLLRSLAIAPKFPEPPTAYGHCRTIAYAEQRRTALQYVGGSLNYVCCSGSQGHGVAVNGQQAFVLRRSSPRCSLSQLRYSPSCTKSNKRRDGRWCKEPFRKPESSLTTPFRPNRAGR